MLFQFSRMQNKGKEERKKGKKEGKGKEGKVLTL